MSARQYKTDPNEVYTLELNKLQRCFSELTTLGENASQIVRANWRQVEYLRQVNFLLQEAMGTGKNLVILKP